MVTYQGKNLREGRHSSPGYYYHVTSVTKDRRPVFKDFIAARLCIHNLKHQHDLGFVTSLAFVVMPDHFHWLIELRCGSLSEVMQSMKGRTARAVNAKFGLTVPLWQSGYYDHALRNGEDIQNSARYLVANPLRTSLVEKLNDYPHWDAVWL